MSYTFLTFGTLVDALAVLVALIFLGRGLIRGVSGEFSRVAGFVGGAWIGYALYPKIQGALLATGGVSPSAALSLTTLVLAALSAFIAGFILRHLLASTLQVVILQPADAIVGMLAGAVYAAAILAIVFALGMLTPIGPVQRLFVEQSHVGRHLCPWLRDHMGLK